jgi:multiple sugar transport system permease protein
MNHLLRSLGPAARREFASGLLFISPWLAGFAVFCLYPVLRAAWLSLTDYSVLSEPVFLGLENYRLLWADELFWRAFGNTLWFAAFSVPVGVSVPLALALLLNQDVPGRAFCRTVFFLPSLLPMVCLGVLWQWLLNGDIGLVNTALRPLLDALGALLGREIHPPNWLGDPAWAKPALLLAGAWTSGNAVVIFLAGLQDVPRHLHEAAQIDGAGVLGRFRHVTLPLLSPVIYFNVILCLIGSLQVFGLSFVIAGGADGPDRSLLFLATYVYRRAFDHWDMGYACAVGLVLFLIVLVITLVAHALSNRFTHYEGK